MIDISLAGLYTVQRQAMLVLATLLQQGQYGLLGHMQGSFEGALCQCLLEMVDAVTQGPAGVRFTPGSSLKLHAAVASIGSLPVGGWVWAFICGYRLVDSVIHGQHKQCYLWSCIMHRADDLLVRKKGIMPASAGCMLCKHVPYQHACTAFRARPNMCKPKPTYEEVQQQLLCCKLHVHTAHHVMACTDIAGCFHFAETLLIHELLQSAPAHTCSTRFCGVQRTSDCFHFATNL